MPRFVKSRPWALRILVADEIDSLTLCGAPRSVWSVGESNLLPGGNHDCHQYGGRRMAWIGNIDGINMAARET